MNPLNLIGMSIVGLLAVYLFVNLVGEHKTDMKTQQAKHELKSAEFDRDFANAWNGKNIEAPSAREIKEKQEKVKKLEAEQASAAADTKEREAELKKTLDEMAGKIKEK